MHNHFNTIRALDGLTDRSVKTILCCACCACYCAILQRS